MSKQRDVAWETTINEFFTHLTALSGGSIVVLAALSTDLDVSGWFSRGLAIAGVAGFVLTIGAGLGAKLLVAQLTSLDLRDEKYDEKYERKSDLMTYFGAAALLFFALALLALGALAITSLLG